VLTILNRRHLERVLRIYVDHYNAQRPHRALKLQPPQPDRPGPTLIFDHRAAKALGTATSSRHVLAAHRALSRA
jgi:hypothetical protein